MLRCIGPWLLMLFAGQATAAGFDAVADLGSQIEYAFYTGETRPLEEALQQLSAAQGNETGRQLYLRYGEWKLAQLLMMQPEQAAGHAERCLQQKATDKPSDLKAMQQALQAVCAQTLASLRPLRAVLYRRERDSLIRQVMQASRPAPVLFMLGWLQVSDDASAAAQLLQQAVAAYDALPAGAASYSSIGAAEASYWLGRVFQQQGRAVAARDQLEKSVLLVPDYRAAQALLKELTLK